MARGCHSGTDGGPCPQFTLEIIVPAAADPAPAPALTPVFKPAPDYDDLAAAAGQ